MFDYECCGFKETEVVKTFAVEGIFFSVTTPSRIANAVSAMFFKMLSRILYVYPPDSGPRISSAVGRKENACLIPTSEESAAVRLVPMLLGKILVISFNATLTLALEVGSGFLNSSEAVVQVCLRTIVMQVRLVAIQSLLNFGVMTVYSGHPKGNICN